MGLLSGYPGAAPFVSLSPTVPNQETLFMKIFRTLALSFACLGASACGCSGSSTDAAVGEGEPVSTVVKEGATPRVEPKERIQVRVNDLLGPGQARRCEFDVPESSRTVVASCDISASGVTINVDGVRLNFLASPQGNSCFPPLEQLPSEWNFLQPGVCIDRVLE